MFETWWEFGQHFSKYISFVHFLLKFLFFHGWYQLSLVNAITVVVSISGVSSDYILNLSASSESWIYLGAYLIYWCRIGSIGNPIVKIRRSQNRLISAMGFPILVRRYLYIESGSWCICRASFSRFGLMSPMLYLYVYISYNTIHDFKRSHLYSFF